MLCTASEVLKDAMTKGYAVGSFNFHNQDVLEAILRGAKEEESPVIVQITPPYIRSLGLEACAAMAKEIIKQFTIPVVLHLDHGDSFELVQRCLMQGFSSIMYDGSKYGFEENIKNTRQVVEAAHVLGISVEGELGSIGGVEDEETGEKEANLINPEDARRFTEETEVNVLAPAIGTAHGIYKKEPVLDYQRLEKVRNLTNVYLALHGGSGLTEEQFKSMIGKGINKINVGTELKMGWTFSTKEAINSGITEPMKIREFAIDKVKEIVKGKIKLFGSNKKA